MAVALLLAHFLKYSLFFYELIMSGNNTVRVRISLGYLLKTEYNKNSSLSLSTKSQKLVVFKKYSKIKTISFCIASLIMMMRSPIKEILSVSQLI